MKKIFKIVSVPLVLSFLFLSYVKVFADDPIPFNPCDEGYVLYMCPVDDDECIPPQFPICLPIVDDGGGQ